MATAAAIGRAPMLQQSRVQSTGYGSPVALAKLVDMSVGGYGLRSVSTS
jgi:hypothetical protein